MYHGLVSLTALPIFDVGANLRRQTLVICIDYFYAEKPFLIIYCVNPLRGGKYGTSQATNAFPPKIRMRSNKIKFMRLVSLVCPALQPTAGGELARQQGGIPVYPIIFSRVAPQTYITRQTFHHSHRSTPVVRP